MRYLLCSILGLAITVAAIVVYTRGLYDIVEVGTCASGGAYEIAQPCPPGHGWAIGSMVTSLFAIFIGGGLFAARGPRSGTTTLSSTMLDTQTLDLRARVATSALFFVAIWSVMWLATAATIWQVGRDGDGAGTAGTLLVTVFGAIGGLSLLLVLLSLARGQRVVGGIPGPDTPAAGTPAELRDLARQAQEEARRRRAGAEGPTDDDPRGGTR